MFRPVLAALLCLNALPLAADEVLVAIPDDKPAVFLVTVGADRSVTVNPTRIIRPSAGPNPSPTPTPIPPGPAPTPFEAEVERRARAAITSGGTLLAGAGLSEAYSLVASGIDDNSLDHTKALQITNAATALVLTRTGDTKWAAFELWVRNDLQVRDGQGAFKTKADYSAALRAVSVGLNRATGHSNLGAVALRADVSTPTKLANARRAFGILDGIDLQKLIDLIRAIIELFKLFAPM